MLALESKLELSRIDLPISNDLRRFGGLFVFCGRGSLLLVLDHLANELVIVLKTHKLLHSTIAALVFAKLELDEKDENEPEGGTVDQDHHYAQFAVRFMVFVQFNRFSFSVCVLRAEAVQVVEHLRVEHERAHWSL